MTRAYCGETFLPRRGAATGRARSSHDQQRPLTINPAISTCNPRACAWGSLAVRSLVCAGEAVEPSLPLGPLFGGGNTGLGHHAKSCFCVARPSWPCELAVRRKCVPRHGSQSRGTRRNMMMHNALASGQIGAGFQAGVWWRVRMDSLKAFVPPGGSVNHFQLSVPTRRRAMTLIWPTWKA